MDVLIKPPKKSGYIGYIGIIIIPFVTFLLGLTVGYNQAKHDALLPPLPRSNVNAVVPTTHNTNQNSSTGLYPDLTLFWDVWDMLSGSYIDTSRLDQQTMVHGAVKGLVESIDDPYTLFMTPKETEDFRNNLSGDLQGIGAELSVKDDHLIIVSPLKDSPAEKAGLKPGDIIYKINDLLTTHMSLTDAVSRIRGKTGTVVTLSIVREGNEQPLEYKIERQEIKIPSISWEMKQDNIAYISINQFGDDTTKEFSNAINQILLKNVKGLVLDLRFNGGGYLDGAVDIVSEFVGGNSVVTTVKRRATEKDEVQRVNGHPRLEEIPLVVLINEGSASASEIVAGAIKDFKRGVLMGEKSFGKGTVQELQPLSDGSSLRITIAKWFTPNNTNVDGVGILPDIQVASSNGNENTNSDLQLDQAVIYLQEKIK